MKTPEQKNARAMELLAPAGGPDAGYAALHYGADAVYLGLPAFSARADAENFTLDQVSEIAGYAHSLAPRRRVYVTVNTLVLQRELNDLVDCLGALSEIGVDALIVQDLGVAHIARRHFPELRLHASTQMTIHNRQGVETARDLGFARVTLARELTLEEIAEASAVPGVETETFVHGALCYAYSGLCLFSSQTLGRSGNRGRCAYLCRDQFTLADPLINSIKTVGKESRPSQISQKADFNDGRDPAVAGPSAYLSAQSSSGNDSAVAGAVPEKAGFLFSMKDLALADAIPALRRAGVAALKIEGRKKSPLYVAATVNYYRKLLEGALSDGEARALAADIQTIFSRSWTSLYVQSRKNRDVIDSERVGHRGTPVGKADGVVRSRSGEGRLRFRTSRALELHDGLQVDVPGLPRSYGFAVDWFRIVNLPKSAAAGPGRDKPDYRFCAPAGSLLEVAMPSDHPDIPRGAAIYCASSQAIKRRYRFARPRPGQFRVRPRADLRIELTPTRLTAKASVRRNNAPPVEGKEPVVGGCSAARCAADQKINEMLRHTVAHYSFEHYAPPITDPIPVEASLALTGDFQAAGDPARMEKTFQEVFTKLGATPFAAGTLAVTNPESRFVPMSQLNPFRRRLLDALEKQWKTALRERLDPVKKAIAVSAIAQRVGPDQNDVKISVVEPFGRRLSTASPSILCANTIHGGRACGEPGLILAPFIPDHSKAIPRAFRWSLKTDRIEALDGFEPEDWSEMDEVIVEIGAEPGGNLADRLAGLSGRIAREHIRLALPVIIRSWESRAIRETLGDLVRAGWTKWQIANVSGWAWLKDLPASPGGAINISADWPVYVINRAAAVQIMELGADSVTLSPEDGLENMKSLLAEWGERAVVIAYQDTPLFISESCVGVRLKKDCAGRKDLCVETLDLTSSFGDRVVAINRRCRTVVINSRPFCLASRFRELKAAGAIRLRADFLFRAYTPEQVRDIWRSLRAGKPVPGTQMANIDRGLAL